MYNVILKKTDRQINKQKERWANGMTEIKQKSFHQKAYLTKNVLKSQPFAINSCREIFDEICRK